MNQTALVIGNDLAALVAALRLRDFGLTVRVMDVPVTTGLPSLSPAVFHGPHEQTEALLKHLCSTSRLHSLNTVSLEFQSASQSTATFRRPFLPGPWHSLLGLAGFSGLSWGSRWRFFNYLEKVWEGRIQLSQDLHLKTAQDWLSACEQNKQAQHRIWNPLCLFLFGTNLEHTSAWPFIESLTHHFFARRSHSRIRIFPGGFGKFLLDPLREYVDVAGVSFLPNRGIRQIYIPENQVEGIIFADGQTHQTDFYVSTLSPFQLTALLPERHLARKAFFHQLTQLEAVPRVILHFQSNLIPSRPRLVLNDSRFHWIHWNKVWNGEGNITSCISCVASGDDTLLSLTDEQLETFALESIQTIFPEVQPQHIKRTALSRHAQSSIAYSPGTMTFRPSHHTPLTNLFLAGHWTIANGVSQVEADIQSANRCADMIRERWPLQPGNR